MDDLIPICDIMRCLMYGQSYGDWDRAAKLYTELSFGNISDVVNRDYKYS